jgi:hypothetical protein
LLSDVGKTAQTFTAKQRSSAKKIVLNHVVNLYSFHVPIKKKNNKNLVGGGDIQLNCIEERHHK